MTPVPEEALQVFRGLRANAHMLSKCRATIEKARQVGLQKYQCGNPKPVRLPDRDPEVEAFNRVAAQVLFEGGLVTPYVVLRCRRRAEKIELSRKTYESRFAGAQEHWQLGYTMREIAADLGITKDVLSGYINRMRTRYGMFAKRGHTYKRPVGLP